MRRNLVVVLLLSVMAVSAIGAGDVLQQLSVGKADAARAVVESFAHGSVQYWGARNALKAASPAARAALVEQALVWTKAYVSSPQFAKDYAAYREESKPRREERPSIDEELKQRREQRQAELAESKKALAEIPAEYRAAAEEGYKAAAEAMKQMDTPEFRKMERDGLVEERRAADEQYQEELARWEEEFPADPRVLVKKRLGEFLEETANVDYDAKLVNRHGKMRFVNEEYEQKPGEWKLAFRAGKDATEKARAFAQAWFREL